MVKKTKLRPRRLFYDKSKNKYYYLIEGKKTFIKTGDVSQKQLVKINIKNIVPTRALVKRRRQPAETTLITSSKKVAPTLLAPISANLTPNLNLYKLKDSEKLGEKITSLEKKIEVLSDTTKTTIPKPTTTTPPPVPPRPTTTTPPPVPPRPTPAKKQTNIGQNQLKIAIRQALPEGIDTYSGFREWFDRNGGNVIVLGSIRKNYDDYSFNLVNDRKFGKIFTDELNAYQSKNPKPTTPETKKPEPVSTQVLNVRTMADILKDSATEGLKGIVKALSPKTSKVAPTRSSTLTTTGDDNLVDRGDINVPAGAPIPTEKGEDDLPIKLPSKGKGKEHENDEDGMYNDELEQIFYDKLHKFVPVISSDEMGVIEKMVNKDTKKIGWIQNTDPKKSKGRHWVAYFINIPEGEINYYDSLVENNGMPSAENMKGLKKIIDKINPEFYLKFKNNLCRFQNPKSNNCGYFSLKFLLDRYSNIPFRECTRYNKVVDRYEEGEMMIKKFKRYL